MLSFYQHAARAIRSTALVLFASVMAHAAAITVSPTVTSIAPGVYQYAYSISNTGTGDAFLIDISVPKFPTAITSLTTPAGFTSQFDSVLGLVSFLENTSSFTASPISGFLFDSTYAPGTANFSASVLDTSGNLSTVSGSTTAPVAAATAVPEPGYFYLLIFMTPLLFILKRRQTGDARRFSRNVNPMEGLHV